MNLRDIILDAAKEAINNDDSITKKDLMVILDKQEAEIRLLKQTLIRSKEVHLIYANPEKFSKELGEDNSYYDPQPPMRRTVYGSGKKAREIISEIDKVIIDSSLLKPRAVSNKTIEDAIHLAKLAHDTQDQPSQELETSLFDIRPNTENSEW